MNDVIIIGPISDMNLQALWIEQAYYCVDTDLITVQSIKITNAKFLLENVDGNYRIRTVKFIF